MTSAMDFRRSFFLAGSRGCFDNWCAEAAAGTGRAFAFNSFASFGALGDSGGVSLEETCAVAGKDFRRCRFWGGSTGSSSAALASSAFELDGNDLRRRPF